MSGEIHSLVRLEELGDTDELRAQAAVEFDVDGAEPSDTYQVAEPTGSIWVTVDHRGRLADVRINHRWADRVDPAAFAGTLFGMYTRAVRKALVVELSHQDEEPPPRSRRPEPEPELSYEEFLAKVGAQLEANETALRALARAEVARHDETELRSEHGYVTLHLRGPNPVGLTANTGVLGYANSEVLRGDVLGVFADAGLTTED
jgi:hypothetical protein